MQATNAGAFGIPVAECCENTGRIEQFRHTDVAEDLFTISYYLQSPPTVPLLNEHRSRMTVRYGRSLALLCVFSLVACGAGGGDESANSGANSTQPPAPPAPAPTVSLSAAPTAVASGGSTLMTWSSTNASSCMATGAWSGAKPPSGNQTINSIAATSTYTLTCTGSGGSTTRSATVTVTGGGA